MRSYYPHKFQKQETLGYILRRNIFFSDIIYKPLFYLPHLLYRRTSDDCYVICITFFVCLINQMDFVQNGHGYLAFKKPPRRRGEREFHNPQFCANHVKHTVRVNKLVNRKTVQLLTEQKN